MQEARIYKSKISLGLIIPVFAIIMGVGIVTAINSAWLGLIVVVLAFLFVVHMFSTTYYTVSGNTLLIKCGFLVKEIIDISTINSVQPTRSVLSAPALSFDRLEIKYNKWDVIVLSPENKNDFIASLKAINPAIG